jgi:putative transposase
MRLVMANTFASLHAHVVFSTKNRARWLTADVEEDVWRTLAEFCRAHKFTALQIGGVDDHVHLAARPRWL